MSQTSASSVTTHFTIIIFSPTPYCQLYFNLELRYSSSYIFNTPYLIQSIMPIIPLPLLQTGMSQPIAVNHSCFSSQQNANCHHWLAVFGNGAEWSGFHASVSLMPAWHITSPAYLREELVAGFLCC